MGGFNFKNNKNNPRIYKNSEEFRLCSVFVKEFKIGLHPVLRHLNDGTLHQRLMGLFMSIKALDRTSDKGALNVREGLQTLKGKSLLQHFVFTPKVGIRQMFGNPEINGADFTLVWKDFDPSRIRFPSGATHFELQYSILAYNPTQHIFTTYTTNPVRRSKEDETERLELLPEKTNTQKKGGPYILVLGLRFLEILGEEEYPLLGQNAVGVEIIGVY